MGHHMVGVVARTGVVEMFARTHGLHAPVALEKGLGLLGLRDTDLDAMAGPYPPVSQAMEESGKLTHLTDRLAEALRVHSMSGPLMYLETDYFGGYGAQGAAAWSNGSRVYGPEVERSDEGRGEWPINRALAVLGVHASGTMDAFDVVGLGRFRSLADVAPEEPWGDG